MTTGISEFNAIQIELIEEGRTLLDRHIEFPKIEQKLKLKSNSVEELIEVMRFLRKEYYAKKRKQGVKKLLIAVILLILGLLFACLNYYSNQSIGIVMYGFTGAGLIFLFWALYDFMG